jgi:hypothetical protein
MREFTNVNALLALLRDGFHPESRGGQVRLGGDGLPVLDYPLGDVIWEARARPAGDGRNPVRRRRALGDAGARDGEGYASWAEARKGIAELPLKPLLCRVVSAHVMGGCGMADTPQRGVVDHRGRHFWLANLSVHDGSVFPTSLGANPQLSIYGLVARNASLLAAELVRQAAAGIPEGDSRMLARALRLSLLLEVALYVALAIYGLSMPRRRLPPASRWPACSRPARRADRGDLRLGLGLSLAGAAPVAVAGAAHGARRVRGSASCSASCSSFPSSAGGWLPTACRRCRQAAGRPGARPPVLLVHGYGCSRAAWWWLRRRLEGAGWTVATISLEPIYGSIDDYVEPLARRIDAVLAETGAERLLLVGHSMGGLVARAYLQRYGARGSPAGDSRNAAPGQPHRAHRFRRQRPPDAARQRLAAGACQSGAAARYSGHLQSARQFRDAARAIAIAG